MKKTYTLAIVLLSLFFGVACSKDTDISAETAQIEKPQLPEYTASINLSATFSSGAETARAYLKPTDDAEIKVVFKDTELMKDGATLDASGKPIRIKGDETGKLTLYFVKKTDLSNVITTTVDPTDFRLTDEGKYVISFHGSLTLPGLDLSNGEWYVSGGYRLGATENVSGNIAGTIYLNADGVLQKSETNVTDFKTAYVFGWTKLATKQDNSAFPNNHGQNLNLNMIPDGYYLRIRAINNLVEDIDLTRLAAHRENFGSRGGYIASFGYKASTPNSIADLVESNTPRVTEPTNTAVIVLGLNATKTDSPSGNWGTGLVLASGDYYPWYQRFNSPTNLSNKSEGSGLVFDFLTKERALGTDVYGRPLDSRETEGLTSKINTTWPQSGPILTDDWRGGTLSEYVGKSNYNDYAGRGFRSKALPTNTTFEPGKVNNVNFKITSDLMITELYTTRYSARNGSFGLIEIYNPTLDDIDLSKYALLRIGYRNDAGTNKIRVVPTPKEYNQAEANPGDNIVANISSALVLPLDMRNGTPTGDWSINSYAHTLTASNVVYRYTRIIQHRPIVSAPVKYDNFATNIVDFSNKGLISGLQAITPGATKLGPGKTMIVLFSGFASSSYRPTQEDTEIFKRIEAAAKAGYCQYVVAIAQGSTTTAQPHETTAGVTTADLGDAFSLVKLANIPIDMDNSGQRFYPSKYRTREARRIFVDGTWAHVDFDKGQVVASLMSNSSVVRMLRRPYGPYLWNRGFLPPSDMSSYYQTNYTGVSQATFGAPYFSSYEPGKEWSNVVAPKVAQRDKSLLKKK